MDYIELDPGGDVMLVLQQPNEQSFPAIACEVESSSARSTASVPGSLRFKVSSKHLVLASPVFKAMLCGNWKEGIALTEKASKQDKAIRRRGAL
ncbi:hypothetical protein E4U41_007722 [Claviceps citrina]|nr:hypothetical protein E4U41_007722 [Claviceps citrina]